MAHTRTHTFAVMEVSQAAYDEVFAKLKKAGYDHAFREDHNIDVPPLLDMDGVALRRQPEPEPTPVLTIRTRVDRALETVEEELSEDGFVGRRIEAGWPANEAKAEWDAIQRGERE